MVSDGVLIALSVFVLGIFNWMQTRQIGRHQASSYDASANLAQAEVTATQNRTIGEQNAAIANYARQVSEFITKILGFEAQQRLDQAEIIELKRKDVEKDKLIAQLRAELTSSNELSEKRLKDIDGFPDIIKGLREQIARMENSARVVEDTRQTDSHARDQTAINNSDAVKAALHSPVPAVDTTQSEALVSAGEQLIVAGTPPDDAAKT
jgi:hypothetical protein